MISKETSSMIWEAYREIEVAEKLLSEMSKIRGREHIPDDAPTLKDAFGRREHLQLGIPSGENCHRLYKVAPKLAESVIRAHIAEKKEELASANERARIELDEAERV
ncbi:MAG: hypothetical protein WC905_02595 [Patescibacteria group bacterium]|jgi:hypothetical protein